MDASIGLVMISSNSGRISPVALMVFSILPISTTAVVISDFFSMDWKEARNNQTEKIKTVTVNMVIRMAFLLFFVITSASMIVSIEKYLDYNLPSEVPNTNSLK